MFSVFSTALVLLAPSGRSGYPSRKAPLALLTFNLGVEAGQLFFVATVLVVFKAVKAFFEFPLDLGRVAAAYMIGTISTFWLVSRVSVF